jgi:hypothetical protein
LLASTTTRQSLSISQVPNLHSRLAAEVSKVWRVAIFQDLGLRWEPEVKCVAQAQRKVVESLGCIVEDAEADFREANECFLALAALVDGICVWRLAG